MATYYKDEIYVGKFSYPNGKQSHIILACKETEYSETWKTCIDRPLILTGTLDEERHYDYRLPTIEEWDFIFDTLPEEEFSLGAHWSSTKYLYDQIWGRSTMGISYGPMTELHICRKIRTVDLGVE
jgi:hypothetical protein